MEREREIAERAHGGRVRRCTGEGEDAVKMKAKLYHNISPAGNLSAVEVAERIMAEGFREDGVFLQGDLVVILTDRPIAGFGGGNEDAWIEVDVPVGLLEFREFPPGGEDEVCEHCLADHVYAFLVEEVDKFPRRMLVGRAPG